MLDKVSILELENGLEVSNLLIRDAHEVNVFDKVEKVTWLEFTVTNSGIRNLDYIEASLTYIGNDNEHLGHEETNASSSLKVKNKILMRIPISIPTNLVSAKLYIHAQRANWPYKMAKLIDRIWVFLKK